VNGQDGNVTFENSEFHATAKDGTPILIDVPVDVSIYGCRFYGYKGAAVFRGGNVSVSGSTFAFDKSKLSAADNNKRNADWGQATTWLWPQSP